jgi:Tol biopolymer transport system component
VPRGGSWSKDGLILFGTADSPIFRVSSEGGKPAPVTKLDIAQKQGSHRWPYFLPDSRHFLYWTRNTDGPSIYAGSIDSDTVKLLFPSDTNAVYAPPGFVLFNREGILMRQGFDPARLELKGEATALAERVAGAVNLAGTPFGLGSFSVSTNGVLSFQTLPSDVTQFAWFDRRGQSIETIGPRGTYQGAALSPDETRLAFTINAEDRGSDLWLMDMQQQSPSRFTFGRNETNAVWSPDGATIFYTSGPSIFQKKSSGTGSEQLVQKGNGSTLVGNVSPDEKFLVFTRFENGTEFDIFVLPLTGERKPIPVVQTRFRDEQPQFAPDGKWIAYTSNESGQPEVYVQPFPTSGSKWQISNGGGTQPMWRHDGKELFFMSEDRKLYATDIHAGSTFEFGMPHSLFDVRGRSYVPSRDGERFLVTMSPDAALAD